LFGKIGVFSRKSALYYGGFTNWSRNIVLFGLLIIGYYLFEGFIAYEAVAIGICIVDHL